LSSSKCGGGDLRENSYEWLRLFVDICMAGDQICEQIAKSCQLGWSLLTITRSNSTFSELRGE
jgi:hypothetical protein